ncbi:MAG: penicillin-binding protein 2 [Actinomycetota bacterium]
MNQGTLGGTRLRLAFLGAIFVSLIATLVLRLYFLQVLDHSSYAEAAQRNQVRLVATAPARGHILDRDGQVLVSNGISMEVSVRRNELSADEQDEVLRRLSGVLDVPVDQLNERLEDKRLSPYAPVPVAANVPEEVVVYIREHQDEFPAVETKSKPIRTYPYGELAAHLLGYLGEINAEQLELERYQDYRPGAIIGRSGIEYAYEHQLHGQEGLEKLEVDATGKVQRTLGRRDPKRGYDLVTTLDIDIQRIAEESLARGLEEARGIYHEETDENYKAPAGGVVVMDPNNGEVVAMASFPTYNPSSFVGGISSAEFNELASDPANPLLNRAIQAAYPPGSIFKPITAMAALGTGVASANDRFPCPGSQILFDQRFRNWKSSDSGMLSLNQAMAESCDTVFYPWGEAFYRTFRDTQQEILQDYSRRFGLGSPTGFELPFEKAGRVPDEEWLKEVHSKYPEAFPYALWLPGYTINMSIGQGDILTTPLQMASVYSAIANGGTLHTPHLGSTLLENGEPVAELPAGESKQVEVDPGDLQAVRATLEAVTVDGTAAAAFSGFPLQSIPVASKTGTSELAGSQPYAWFAAYAPADDPRYVVVVMLEEGGHGGETAAPVARRVLEGLFDLDFSTITPGEATD